MSSSCICTNVPHHITAIFLPKYTGDPATTGSYGAGIVVGPEAIVCYGKGERPSWQPLKGVVEELKIREAKFEIRDPLPYGMGYASSAAAAIGGALSSAYANGISVKKALLAAHVAEVNASTGLGDVQAIASNPLGEGIVLRIEPGPPFSGDINVIPIPSSISILSIELGKMSTKSLLSTYNIDMAREAQKALKVLFEDPSFSVFLDVVSKYTSKLSLLETVDGGDRLKNIVESLPGLLGYYVKKKLIIALVEEDYIRDAIDHTIKNGLKVRVLERRTSGLKVVERRCDHV